MAKVLIRFKDKETGVVYNPGSQYAGNRVAELSGKGFIEPKEIPVKKEKVEVTPPKKKKK